MASRRLGTFFGLTIALVCGGFGVHLLLATSGGGGSRRALGDWESNLRLSVPSGVGRQSLLALGSRGGFDATGG